MQQLTCTGPGHVEWREVASPALESDVEALVRPLAVARCDIDLFLTRGFFGSSEPFALGHECVGEIEALGDAVQGLEIGQRVVVSFQVSCGTCAACTAGNTANCDLMPTLSDYGMRPLSGLEYGGMLSERFCLECHADIRRDDPDREIKAVLTPVDELRTDPAMAANFANRVNESGRLKRRFKTYIGFPGVSDRFEEKGAGVEFLGYGVIGAITRQFLLDPLVTVEAIKAGRPSTRERVLKDVEEILEADPTTAAKLKVLDKIIETLRPAPTGLVYKGRPLNGIWATAPYLHNGSVRTMRQLLLPASERQTTFRVGSREYDPHDMGFEDAGGYPFDTTVAGNSNAGHEGIRYGSETFKNDSDLLDALLEYLKTL